MAEPHDRSEPQAQLSVLDAVAIMVGLVVGIGIFRTPSLVAGGVSSEWMFILVWVLGGLITLIGALCYAELAAAHPHAGGEYHFLSRAYGRSVALMFGWARCTVIQTGSIALVAFLLGDYVALVAPIGPYGPGLYAALAVVVLTAVNVIGTAEGKNLQIVVTVIQLAVMLAIIGFGFFGTAAPLELSSASAPAVPPPTAALGMAMILVLLTYGGWNDAAYLTGELKDAPRNIAKVLTYGTALLVGLYVLANMALLSILGLDGLRASDAVAADMMRVAAGPSGELLVTLAIIVAAISTLNATIFTGSRVFYAMGRDLSVMRWVGVWNGRGKTPANAQIVQGVLALALIAMGSFTRDGFKAMVDYTAPVFWMFLLLVGFSLFVLRHRQPLRALPFEVPFYPLTPIVFCLTCVYMLYASVMHTGAAALVGLGVLIAGAPILLFKCEQEEATPSASTSHSPGDLP